MENKNSIITKKKELLDRRYNKKGLLEGLFSGFTFALNGLFISMALDKVSVENIITLSLVGACLNDVLAAIWLIIYNIINGRGKEIGRSFKIFPGKIVCLGALLGGPLAQSGYLIGMKYAGVSYAVAISALYAAVGAILSRIFLKQKIEKRVAIGILISAIGGIVISYIPPVSIDNTYFYLGIFAASFAAFGWAAEGVIGAFGTAVIDPKIAITIREMTSGIVFLVFIMPLVGGYTVLKDIFYDISVLKIFIIAALFAAISFLMWYKANNSIGVAKGMALNSTYVAWGIVLPVIFLNSEYNRNLFIGGVLVLIGSILVSINPFEKFRRGENNG